MVKTYSRNQKTLAMSSGEAELYAIVSGVSEGIGVQSVLADYGIQANVHVYTDSSAAIGITKRYGNGRIRHLQTQFLWIQGLIADSRVTIHKVGGKASPADLMTKYLSGECIKENLDRMHLSRASDRPSNAPSVEGVEFYRYNQNRGPQQFSCVCYPFAWCKLGRAGCIVLAPFRQPTCTIGLPPTSAFGLSR